MILELRKRTLDKIAYRYHLKDKHRNHKENWKLAEKLLDYIDKRRSLMEKIICYESQE